MFPPVTTAPAIATPIPQVNSVKSIEQPTTSSVSKLDKFSKTSVANWKDRDPVISPDLHQTPASKQIAQSELPGGSTPPVQAPPSPSIRDTGSGYPTRIPSNYFGPAIGFGNGGSAFGVVSRFPFSENYSIRPSAVFGTRTTIRVPITYDFSLGEKEPFERNPLVTFHAGGGVQFSSGGGSLQGDKFALLGTIGVDVNLFEGIALLGSFNTDFANNNGTNIGLGFEF
jgi:hypothetical protein